MGIAPTQVGWMIGAKAPTLPGRTRYLAQAATPAPAAWRSA
ncbi:hypothetical protein FHR55_003231 [Xanthomonas arboricola]